MTHKQSNHLSYKFQRLREAVRTAILSGELTGKLPGERQLAKRFRANAKTISKALSDLTGEGLLIRQVGRGTFVADCAAARGTVGKKRRLRWLTETGCNHEHRESIFRKAAELAQDAGHQLRAEAVEVDAAGELPESALPPSALREVDGIVVFASRPAAELLADLNRRHIPLVLWNSVFPQAKANAVHADYARGAYELAEHLIGMGHHGVRLVLPTIIPSVFEDAIRGYETAIRRYGIEPIKPLRAHHDSINGQIELQGSSTAFIVADGELAASIVDAARDRGRSVPNDISLAVLDEPGATLAEQLDLTSYEVDPDHMTHWAMRLLLEHAPGRRPQEVFVPGRLIDRGSAKSLAGNEMSRWEPKETLL
jgi:LacI family transcriptional regulator